MKAKRLFLPLALAAIGTSTMAQSVTIFGRMDMGLQYIDMDGAKRTGLDTGIYTASRLGFKGAEDLGGGLSALFHLEMGIGGDSGTTGGSRLFNRGSLVGLSGKSLGTLTLGRQYPSTFWPFLNSEEAGPLRLHGYSAVNSIQRSNLLRVAEGALQVPLVNGTLASGTNGIYSVGISSTFENNLAVYKTPSFDGLTASLALGAPEGYTDSGKLYGANVEYSKGPLYLGGAFNRKYGLVPATGTNQRTDEAVLGALYAFTDSFKLWGNLHYWAVDPGLGYTLEGDDFMVGASYWVGVGEVWANYARKSVGSCTDCDSNGFGVGYNHFLSKCTELYAAYGRVANQRNAANTLGGFSPILPGGTVQGLALGIAHVF